MPKPLILLIVLVVIGGGIFLALGPGGEGGPEGADDEYGYDDPGTYTADPELQARGGDPTRDLGARAAGDPDPDRGTSKDQPVTWLAGRVTDARTGAAIAGARLYLENARGPCPRTALFRPAPPSASDSLSSLDDVTHGLEPPGGTTAADGTFGLKRDSRQPARPVQDVFVFATGYVATCICRATGTDLDIRLEPEHIISGRVVSPSGHPVEGALVTTIPAEGLPLVEGSVALDTTNREGMFRLDGLGAPNVMVTVDHAKFMPTTVGPREPGDPSVFEIRMTPAYLVTFHIRTADGEAVVNPTLHWITEGNPPSEDLLIIQGTPAGPAARPKSEIKSETLRIPCDRRVVDFELKADGYMPWRIEGEPLPADGGARSYPVVLSRDASAGALRVALKDAEGKSVSYAKSAAVLSMAWMGAAEQTPSSFVMQATEVLDLPSIQAGPYRITVRSALFAPAEADITVVAGVLTQIVLTTAAPARLKVHFVAAEKTTVHFRITQEGRVITAFPVGREPVAGQVVDPNTPLRAEGGAGQALVLTGLGTGQYAIEVTSEHLRPTRHIVRLTAGETHEAEVQVERK